MKPHTPIRILIVEDDPGFAEMAERLVRPILDAFPGSSVTTVRTIEGALEAVAELHAPDVTLLDLTLPPSGVVETLSHLDTFEDRTAVVIVTGQKEELVRKLIGDRATPVVEKSAELLREPGPLVVAIYLAVDAFQQRRWAKQRADLAILRGVTMRHA